MGAVEGRERKTDETGGGDFNIRKNWRWWCFVFRIVGLKRNVTEKRTCFVLLDFSQSGTYPYDCVTENNFSEN